MISVVAGIEPIVAVLTSTCAFPAITWKHTYFLHPVKSMNLNYLGATKKLTINYQIIKICRECKL